MRNDNRLLWYWRRARAMSWREIPYRVAQHLDKRRLRHTWRTGAGQAAYQAMDPQKFHFCRTTERQMPELDLVFDPGPEDIAAILRGSWHAPGYDWAWADDDRVWHRAPDTGRDWPRTFFGEIDFRPGNAVGDARVIWEPARLQQLLALALITRDRDDAPQEQAVALIEKQFLHWLRANPPLHGIHYVSAMECALRLIAVCHALDLVREHLGTESEVWPWLPAFVRVHADLVRRKPSLHSSAGNHTIAEAAGLIHAGLLFPEFDEAADWHEFGIDLLAQEADRQILPDGGGIEQAFWYHAMVVDLCGLAESLIARNASGRMPDSLPKAVMRGRQFLATFGERPEDLPTIGDGDDGHALLPGLRPSWSTPTSHGILTTFEQSGYSRFMVCDDPAIHAVLDHGEFGMAPSFGHAHADALSLTLCLAGRQILVDPGTYSYGGEPEWRAYFRGTRAHNTVLVDGMDQANQQTAFQWSSPCRAWLAQSGTLDDDRTLLLAGHSGYERIGLRHWRGVVIYRGDGLLVWDFLMGRGQHDLELNWHIDAPVGALPESGQYVVGAGNDALSLEVSGGRTSTCSAKTAPILGWMSRRYGTKSAVTTLQAVQECALPALFLTRIRTGTRFGAFPTEQQDIETLENWAGHS